MLTAARQGATPTAAGRVGRRRALPNGRALAGGFFVAVAAVAVLAVWLSSTTAHGRSWVVAARDLPVGARLGPSDLTTESLSLPATGVGSLAFSSPAPLVGDELASPLRAGELVQAGDIATGAGPTGVRPVTVAVAGSDLVDLDPGAVVDVLVTDGTDPSSPTLVVVGGARVLSLDRPSSTLGAGLGSPGSDVTLGVTSLAQVTAVVHAAHTGTISVVEGAPGDASAADATPASTGSASGTAAATGSGAPDSSGGSAGAGGG